MFHFMQIIQVQVQVQELEQQLVMQHRIIHHLRQHASTHLYAKQMLIIINVIVQRRFIQVHINQILYIMNQQEKIQLEF